MSLDNSIARCRIVGCQRMVNGEAGMCVNHSGVGRIFLQRLEGKYARWAAVYAVKVCDFVKIGVAEDVSARVSSMQSGCPFQMDLLGTIDARRFVEDAIHLYLAGESAQGEWFHAKGLVLDVVDAIRAKDSAKLAAMVGVSQANIGAQNIGEPESLESSEYFSKVLDMLNLDMAQDLWRTNYVSQRTRRDAQ